jgi:hypothetical protein
VTQDRRKRCERDRFVALAPVPGDHAAAEDRQRSWERGSAACSTPAASLQDLVRLPTPWSPAEMLDLPPGPACEHAQLISRRLSCGHPATKNRTTASRGAPGRTVASRTGVPRSRGRPAAQPRVLWAGGSRRCSIREAHQRLLRDADALLAAPLTIRSPVSGADGCWHDHQHPILRILERTIRPFPDIALVRTAPNRQQARFVAFLPFLEIMPLLDEPDATRELIKRACCGRAQPARSGPARTSATRSSTRRSRCIASR